MSVTSQWVEARCPQCSKTHNVQSKNGTITQTAYCPPSVNHRKWVEMRPGAAQAAAKKAR